jgi:hypothetical protein
MNMHGCPYGNEYLPELELGAPKPNALKPNAPEADAPAAACLRIYRQETDEQLLQRIRDKAAELGRLPRLRELPGFCYLKARFGSWPRMMEKAGIKAAGNRVLKRDQRQKRKRRGRTLRSQVAYYKDASPMKGKKPAGNSPVSARAAVPQRA